MRAGALLVAIFFGHGAAPQTAHGQPSLNLTWSAPSHCPDVASVRAKIRRHLKSEPDIALEAHARVTPNAPGYTLELRWVRVDGAQTERSLHARSCEALADGAALIIALAIEPDTALDTPPQTPSRSDAMPSHGTPRPDPEPAHDTSSGTEEPLRILNRLGGFVDAASLPAPSLGLGASVGFEFGRWQVDVGALYLLPRTATTSAVPGAARVQLVSGAATGCFAVLGTPLRLAPCIGIEAGVLLAEGEDLDVATSSASPWLAPSARLTLAYPFSRRLSAQLDVGLVIPLTRPRYLIQGQQVHRPAPVALRAGVGIVFFL